MKTIVTGRYVMLIIVVLFSLCIGCSTGIFKKEETAKAPPASATATPQPKTATPLAPIADDTFYIHTVRWSGESISIIAGWYTGDIQNWKALAEANPGINPNHVHEGMQIRIPERMMTNKNPMTKEYVDSFYPKTRKTGKAPAAQKKEKEEEPQLFGPREYPQK